jgi:hypothetical protein
MSTAATRTTPRRSVKSAREILSQRLLTIVGQERDVFRVIDPLHGGVVLTGQQGFKEARRVGNRNENIVLLVEPNSFANYDATAEQPFVKIADDNALFDLTPDDFLDQQVTVADAAIFPAGHLRAGQRDTLRALVETANEHERNDVILLIIADPMWLIGSDLKKLIYWVKQSKHPVALGFSSVENPLSTIDHHRGYRDLFAETGAFAWRADHAGLDAYAHGAMGAAIGVIPSLRKATPPGEQNKARNPHDKRPHLSHPSMRRYVRTSELELWYVNRDAPCFCGACGGERLDRLSATSADKLIGACHNATIIATDFEKIRSAEDRVGSWRVIREDAVLAHQALTVETGRDITLDPALGRWKKMDAEQPVKESEDASL